MDNNLHVEDSKLLLGLKKPVYNSLWFSGDKIEFSDRTCRIRGFTVREFIEQFDRLVFVDRKGQKTVYEKKKRG